MLVHDGTEVGKSEASLLQLLHERAHPKTRFHLHTKSGEGGAGAQEEEGRQVAEEEEQEEEGDIKRREEESIYLDGFLLLVNGYDA